MVQNTIILTDADSKSISIHIAHVFINIHIPYTTTISKLTYKFCDGNIITLFATWAVGVIVICFIFILCIFLISLYIEVIFSLSLNL